MTDAELIAHLAELWASATPGEWKIERTNWGQLEPHVNVVVGRQDKDVFGSCDGCEVTSEQNAAFIVAMSNAMPRLLELARYGSKSEALRQAQARIEMEKAYGRLLEERDALHAELTNQRAASHEWKEAADLYRSDLDRYLAALKVEACEKALSDNPYLDMYAPGLFGEVHIGGATFRVTRKADGDLTAKEIRE